MLLNFRKLQSIVWLVALALIIRILVIGWALQYRENTDILRWKDWARISYLYSFADSYKNELLSFGTYANNMPPGTLYVVSAVHAVWLEIGKILALVWGIVPGSNAWINGPFLTLLLRIPSILADIGIAVLLFHMVKSLKRSEKSGLIAAGLFLFNPVILFNSAFMGQMDAIDNLFFLLGVWALITKRYYWAVSALAVSLLVKFSLLFMVPLFGYIAYRARHSFREVLGLFVLGALVTLMAIVPIDPSPITWYWNFFTHNASGEMSNLTAFAFNGWWALFHPHVVFGQNSSIFSASEIRLIGAPFADERWFGIPLGFWAVGVWSIFCVPFIWKLQQVKNIIKPQTLILFMSVVTVFSFLWLPKMHDRYLYPAIPLLTLAVGLGIPIVWELAGLTILNLINLFIVWHPVALYPMLYTILSYRDFQWSISIMTVFVSFILYIRSLRLITTI